MAQDIRSDKVKKRAKKAKKRLGTLSSFFGGLIGSASKAGKSRKDILDARIKKATGG